MENNLRIVFMGTPGFAAHILNELVNSNYNIVGVVTTPDRAAGRGYKLQSSDVKKTAVQHQLPILQPENLKDSQFHEDLAKWDADLFVVIAFRMLPKVVWSMPKKGTFNLHGSLLPQYRGAAPINWAIINGEDETGVTTFFIDEKIDTGNIILKDTCRIDHTDTAGSLHDKLMVLGAGLVQKTLDNISNEAIKTTAQEDLFADEQQLRDAPKIFKPMCEINFNQSTTSVYNFIRGLNPYPAAHCLISSDDQDGVMHKIFNCDDNISSHSFQPGHIETDGKNFYRIYCLDGFLEIKEIQQAGKRKMAIGDYLRGLKQSDTLKVV